jgi:hypothetical protein
MSDPFYEHPILNSPYEYPRRHWEFDPDGQPTQRIIESRRRAEFITPIPKPRKRKAAPDQGRLVFDEGKGLSTEAQQYDPTAVINEVRRHVDAWRVLPNQSDWHVTPETARLLEHWRHHRFSGKRPFFCQIEAVETLIWLTEVAPSLGKTGNIFLEYLANANTDANLELSRVALKLATGSGKTTVMAMVIAWQVVNALRRPASKRYSRGFLVVSPGITIRDRLRVLKPNDPDSYYASRELVPDDMLADIAKAKIVITNYHAFMLRERMDLSKGGRSLLQGRGAPIQTLETEGQMLQRVIPELMGLKNILVINDEAHHCYREKSDPDAELASDEKREAEENNAAAHVWVSGLETINRKIGLCRVLDLSATPFFLSGSGYAEGTLFPWTMSDFSLMDAIECGIVKLPRDDKRKVRVAGPFTVESLSPHRVLGVDENDELIDGVAQSEPGYGPELDFAQMILENLKTAGVQQAHKDDKIVFTSLTPWPGELICAEGRYTEGSSEKRAGILIGPEFGTVNKPDLVAAAKECGDAGFDILIACAFNYDAHSSEFAKLGHIPILKARMNADLHMADDLRNNGKGNIFVIFGEPDIDILPADSGMIKVKVNGVDVFHPNTGEVRSDGSEGIACWFIDSEYNEESFFVRQAYFLGAGDPYSALKTSLKAEINADAWATLNSDTSRPFEKPKSGRIAVKVINHLGDEVMKVFRA